MQPLCDAPEEECGPREDSAPSDEPLHKTLTHQSLYYTFLQRYFQSYCSSDGKMLLHLHSNGLVLLALNPAAFPDPILAVLEQIRAEEVKGKKKKGGTRVGRDTVVCRIGVRDGEEYCARALVEGVILEVNDRLSKESALTPQGYICVVQARAGEIAKQTSKMRRIH